MSVNESESATWVTKSTGPPGAHTGGAGTSRPSAPSTITTGSSPSDERSVAGSRLQGLRELRQHATNLVRRAERGETVTVAVSGREVAQLGPLQRTLWGTWDDIVAVFEGPSDGRLGQGP